MIITIRIPTNSIFFEFLYTDNLVNVIVLNYLINIRKKLYPFNPFSTNAPLLYPLKTSENRRFSDVFGGYRKETLVENG